MNYQCYRSIPALSQYVDCFWSLDLTSSGNTIIADKVLPDGKTELIFHYGDQFEISRDGVNFVRQGRALFSGQLKQFKFLRPTGNVGMIAVRFKPAGAARFFKFGFNELSDQVAEFESLVGKEGRDLLERVLNAPSHIARIRIINDYLILKIKNQPEDILLESAVKFLEAGIGESGFKMLARKVGLSERQIERKFKSKIGVSMASLSRVLRFQRFLRLAEENPAIKLTEAAHQCGYFDQSHFIRDFRAFSGDPPTSYLSELNKMSFFYNSAPELSPIV